MDFVKVFFVDAKARMTGVRMPCKQAGKKPCPGPQNSLEDVTLSLDEDDNRKKFPLDWVWFSYSPFLKKVSKKLIIFQDVYISRIY